MLSFENKIFMGGGCSAWAYSNGCKSLISLVWEVGKCENRRQLPFMISIYLLPDSKRRMRLYQMVVVYYFRLIFFLISFASLNRLLGILWRPSTGWKSNKVMPRRAGHVRYVFVALTLRAKWATMLAPQQTIMRASAILRCKGATAKLDFIWILNTLPFRGLRCANMQRRSEAKHCSSLCLQSEGDEYCGGQARAKNPTKSWPRALAMFATCSWQGGVSVERRG